MSNSDILAAQNKPVAENFDYLDFATGEGSDAWTAAEEASK